MKRRWRFVAVSLEESLTVVAGLRAATLVVDVEPLIVPWRGAASVFVENAMRLRTAVRKQGGCVSDVILTSNSRRERPILPRGEDLPTTVVTAARKPWRTSYVRGRPQPIVVVGDQVLTDGMLAWRLNASFVHCTSSSASPCWARVQAFLGRILLPFVFTTYARDVTNGDRLG